MYSAAPKAARRPCYRGAKKPHSSRHAEYIARQFAERKPGTMPGAGGGADYAEEGRKLLARVGVADDAAASVEYSGSNAIYKAASGATLHVGNAACAASREKLDAIQCTRIVYCQDSGEGRMKFRHSSGGVPTPFKYLPFEIGRWRQNFANPSKPTANETRRFFAPLFAFVESNLASGENVLIHCLAGAHRAGTVGVACLMHFAEMDRATATQTAQAARPVISPIGDFPVLLDALERAEGRRTERVEPKREADRACGAPVGSVLCTCAAGGAAAGQEEPEPEPEPA